MSTISGCGFKIYSTGFLGGSHLVSPRGLTLSSKQILARFFVTKLAETFTANAAICRIGLENYYLSAKAKELSLQPFDERGATWVDVEVVWGQARDGYDSGDYTVFWQKMSEASWWRGGCEAYLFRILVELCFQFLKKGYITPSKPLLEAGKIFYENVLEGQAVKKANKGEIAIAFAYGLALFGFKEDAAEMILNADIGTIFYQPSDDKSPCNLAPLSNLAKAMGAINPELAILAAGQNGGDPLPRDLYDYRFLSGLDEMHEAFSSDTAVEIFLGCCKVKGFSLGWGEIAQEAAQTLPALKKALELGYLKEFIVELIEETGLNAKNVEKLSDILGVLSRRFFCEQEIISFMKQVKEIYGTKMSWACNSHIREVVAPGKDVSRMIEELKEKKAEHEVFFRQQVKDNIKFEEAYEAAQTQRERNDIVAKEAEGVVTDTSVYRTACGKATKN